MNLVELGEKYGITIYPNETIANLITESNWLRKIEDSIRKIHSDAEKGKKPGFSEERYSHIPKSEDLTARILKLQWIIFEGRKINEEAE